MFSPLLIKIGFVTISSVGVAVGGYFVYKKTSSKKEKEVFIKSSVTSPSNVDGASSIG